MRKESYLVGSLEIGLRVEAQSVNARLKNSAAGAEVAGSAIAIGAVAGYFLPTGFGQYFECHLNIDARFSDGNI